jgi:hypothetical protein
MPSHVIMIIICANDTIQQNTTKHDTKDEIEIGSEMWIEMGIGSGSGIKIKIRMDMI